MGMLSGAQAGYTFKARASVTVFGLKYGYIWLDTSGDCRISTTVPSDIDSDGTVLGVATGASVALSNLAGVAINASLLAGNTNSIDLGSLTKTWRTLYVRTSMILAQASFNYTVTWADPGAARALTIPDPGGADSFAFIAAAQTLTNKTISGASNTLTVRGNDISIPGAAQGDVFYHNGTAWTRLAAGVAGQALITNGAGANPYWGSPSISLASSLANSVTAEAGATDYTIAFGVAGGAYTLTVPAVGGHRTFAFIDEAQTFTAIQTFPNSGLHVLDTNASHDLIITPGSDLTADRIFTITTGDAARTLTMGGDITTLGAWTQVGAFALELTLTGATTITLPASGTLAVTGGALGAASIVGGSATELTSFSIRSSGAAFDLIIATTVVYTADRTLTINIPAGANAALTLGGDFVTGGAWTHTGAHTVGITTQNTVAIAFVDAAAVTLTFPTGAVTLIGRDTTDTLTNKTYDALGAGNVLSNINGANLDPITPGASTYGIPIIITYTLTNQAAAVNIFNANAPFKFRVIRAWSVSTSADGGTWKLNNAAGGGGTDITNAVTVAAADEDFDEPTDYNDAAWEIASGGSLSVVPDGAGLLDCVIYIEAIRID